LCIDAINVHSFLKDRLVLKGGTALNLFIFDVPRLSVDIDLNYVGAQDRDTMLKERVLIEQDLEAVFKREGFIIRRIPSKHAGGKWRLQYNSVLQQQGSLAVDLNFMFRVPLWTIEAKVCKLIGGRQTGAIPILNIHELAAGKLKATPC
jgi:predicted nucleotidyltransferase component of viral defense system